MIQIFRLFFCLFLCVFVNASVRGVDNVADDGPTIAAIKSLESIESEACLLRQSGEVCGSVQSPSSLTDLFDSEPADRESTWILDGQSFIEKGVHRPIPFVMGVVKISPKSENVTIGHFTLTNDVEFQLIRNSDSDGSEWTVEILHKTQLVGAPMDLLIEQKLLELFLSNGKKIEFEQVNSSFMISTEDHSALQFIPLPHFFTAVPTSETIEGEWRTTLSTDATDLSNKEGQLKEGGQVSLDINLSLTKLTKQIMLLVIEGLNTHQAFFSVDSDGTLLMDAVSSTKLAAEEKELEQLENEMVEKISQSTHLKIGEKDEQSKTPVLTFTNPSTSVTFERPIFSDREHHFKQISVSHWQWVPKSIKGSESLINSESPVLMEVRRSGITIMLDVYTTEGTHIRALHMPTVGDSNIKSTVIVNKGNEDKSEEEKEIVEFLKKLLNEFESVDSDISGGFLTLIAPDASLSFSAAPVPSPGLWVLEPRMSQREGESLNISSRPSLSITKEGARLRASLHAGASLVDFLIADISPLPTVLDWRVEGVAIRASESDGYFSDFFHEGVKVEMGRAWENAGMKFSNNNGDELVFLHPLELTSSMVGEWKLITAEKNEEKLPTSRPSRHIENHEHPISLHLSPAGVGEVVGELRGHSRFSVHMKEVLVPGETELEQMHWDLDLVRLPAPRFFKKKQIEKPEIDPVAEMFGDCDGWKIEASELRLSLSCGDGKAEFVKVVDRRVQRLVQGQWIVEFVTSEDQEGEHFAINEGESMTLSFNRTRNSDNLGSDTEPEWSDESISVFNGSASIGGHQLAEFKLLLNPFGGVRVEEFKKAESLENISFEDSSKNILSTLRRVIKSEEKTAWIMEVLPSQMTFTDGNSMVALSRATRARHIRFAIFGADEEADEEAAPQEPQAPQMLRAMERRLQAAYKLETLIAGSAEAEEKAAAEEEASV